MAQDNISTLSIFVNAQVGGAIESLEALEKAAVELGPAFVRSLRETSGSVDVFDAKLRKLALGFTRGNYGANVQKQVDQIRAYYQGLQNEVSNFKLKDPSFDNNEFQKKLKTRINILDAHQVQLDKFGPGRDSGKEAPVTKNSTEDKHRRWLAIAQSKADRRAEQERNDQKAADDRRALEMTTQRKQELRLETARRLDDKIGEDYYRSGLGTGRGESNRLRNERALAAAADDEARRKQQLRIDTARRLDQKIDEDHFDSTRNSPSNAAYNRRQQDKLAAERRIADQQQQRERELARARENGNLDAIRMRQREMRIGIGGAGSRNEALTSSLLGLRPGDNPALKTQYGLAQTEHLVNRPVARAVYGDQRSRDEAISVFDGGMARKEVVSNFKSKVNDLDLGQLEKFQGKMQQAIKLTDPADLKRLERYKALLGETERAIGQVRAKGTVPLRFTNAKELESYTRGLVKLERNLEKAEREGRDVAVSLKRVRDEIGRINATPVKDLFQGNAGNRRGGGATASGMRIGANSETRNFRFVSQQLAFGADDFMQTYQLGGLKSGMRAMSNNLTAIAGLAIPNPALAAGAVVGISALSASLPPLVDWLNSLSTGVADLERVNAEIARIQHLAAMDAKIKILIDDSDLNGLEAYIKQLENTKIKIQFEAEYLEKQASDFEAEAKDIAGIDGEVPSTTEAVFADLGLLIDKAVKYTAETGKEYLANPMFDPFTPFIKQADSNIEENTGIVEERRKYLEALANKEALTPKIQETRKKEKEIGERIDYAKKPTSDLRRTEESLDRSDNSFDTESKMFMESLRSRDKAIRDSYERPAEGDQAALSSVTRETTEKLETFKETVAVVTPVVDQFVRSFDNSINTTFNYNKEITLPPESTMPVAMSAVGLPEEPIVASSFSGMASVPAPKLPHPNTIADANVRRLEAIETRKENEEIDRLKGYHTGMASESIKSQKAFMDNKQDYMFDYRYDADTGQVSGDGLKFLKGTSEEDKVRIRSEVEQLKQDVYDRSMKANVDRRDTSLPSGTVRPIKIDDGRRGGFSSVSPAVPVRDYMGGDGAELLKVGTPQFDEPIAPVAGTFEPMRLPETIAEFTRKVDEFYDRHLMRKEEELRRNNPGLSFDKLNERMEPQRVKANKDRDAAIQQHTATYEIAEKRIQTEKDAADRMRDGLLGTVDPRRKLEEDFLKRQKSILGNRAITDKQRGELLELSKQAFDINADQMASKQPKPINNGIDVGSRADAELKQHLLSKGDTKSLAIQQIIADHLAMMNDKTDTTNKLLKKNQTTGAAL